MKVGGQSDCGKKKINTCASLEKVHTWHSHCTYWRSMQKVDKKMMKTELLKEKISLLPYIDSYSR